MVEFDILSYKCGLRDALAITIRAIKEKNVETTAELLPSLQESFKALNDELIEAVKEETVNRILN